MGMALIAVLNASVVCGAATGGWMAGVARVDITPEEPMWLAGYAARDHEAEGTLHPLWLKALALQNAQGRRAVLVTSDLLGFPKNVADQIRDRLRERLQLERSQIILNASHTHSGPVIYDSLTCMYSMDAQDLDNVKRYTTQLEDKAVMAVEEAFRALEPAQLASANGVTRFAVNRRTNRESAIASTHDLNGPVDHAVPAIRVVGEDGTPIALVFGYACHCTVLDGYQWCGDYPGFAQIALEQTYPGCTAMFFAGCGADQNPLPRRSAALAEQYGKELAAAVERVLAEPMQSLEPTLASAYVEAELRLSAAPSREQLVSIAQEAPAYKRRCVERLIAELDAAGDLRTSYPYPVVLWRLGAQTIVALGGEVVVDYAIFIKRMLGHDTFVMGYTNDVMGYIPSERVLEEGGYEGGTAQILYGMPSAWEAGVEERVLNAVRELAVQVGAVKDADALRPE